MFSFTLEQTKGRARAGTFTTEHGSVATPIFMPVGTQATVKSLDAVDVAATEAQIILANTYHLYLRPGTELLHQAGGIHNFMKWQKPILTDSGGFQVFSLGLQAKHRAGQQKLAKITDQGVTFTSHLDGSKHTFTPESAIEIQRQIVADIIMTFDECTPDGASESYALRALDRTHRWAAQCKQAWEKAGRRSAYGQYQALFGIVQGARIEELRKASAKAIVDLGFDGVAVGGESIGYQMTATTQIMDWIEPLLPADIPRYAMGLGRDPQDLIDAVLAGFDMFDCVGPSRLARNGSLYVGEFDVSGGTPVFRSEYRNARLSITNSRFASDQSVIDQSCDCYTCQQGYTRAYLHHLAKTKELLYYRLATMHNVRVMIRLSESLRSWVLD